MSKLVVVFHTLSFIIGNLLGTSYSIHLFYRSIAEKKFDTIFPAFIGVLIINLPVIIVPVLSSSITNNDDLGSNNWFSNTLFYLIFFGVGLKWTKSWWGYLVELESDNSSNTLPNEGAILFPNTKLKEAIYELCSSAGMLDVELYLCREKQINGYAKARLIGPKSIVISEGCLHLEWEEIAAIIGHEIVHLRLKDTTALSALWRIIGVLTIIFVFIGYMLLLELLYYLFPLIGNLFGIISLPIVLMYEIGMLTFMIIDNRRYWYQIQELRADRLSCQLPGVTLEGAIKVLKKLKAQEDNLFENLSWYQKLFLRYFIVTEHPSIDRRISLLEKYKKWSLIDYIIHYFQITKWFFFGRGWNGR
ncbi:M56 family metallopeptidase [Brevibacillus porteri]|uniref:M48 family metallopeptidase n=1 Tax=Brevibacillus porteri TaxID=2126350 RepID=UPI003D20ADF4